MIQNADGGLIRLLKKNAEALTPRQISDSLARLEVKINLLEIDLPEPAALSTPNPDLKREGPGGNSPNRANQEHRIEKADDPLKALFEEVRQFAMGLGGDVSEKVMKFYIAYQRKENFLSCQVQTRSKRILAWLALNPDTIKAQPGFIRDVRKIGHHGTGDVEIIIASHADLERAKPLIASSYCQSQ
jgi:predicted transport protein